MLISSLKIKNYRGLDINIEKIEKVSIVIGQNDSGKTNICSAIMKVLDYNKRRIPFIFTWIFLKFFKYSYCRIWINYYISIFI